MESNNKIEENKPKGKKNKNPKKSKEDYYVLVMPDKVRSLRAKIANKVVEVLREYPLSSEKDIILRLILEDPEVKEYFKATHDISYMRYVIWSLAKQKIILKARVLGDNKHVYFFLPEQINELKEKIVMSPPGYTPVNTTTVKTSTSSNTSISTSRKKEEDWEEEEEEDEDEWFEECLKNDEC
jgi:hypothetical protein